MQGLKENRVIRFLSLVLGTLALTAAARHAAAQGTNPCGSGQINSCKYGAGTPCSSYASAVGSCMGLTPAWSCPNDPSQAADWWEISSLAQGNWYRCTAAGSGLGACTESMTLCLYFNTYQKFVQFDPNYPGTCQDPCGSYSMSQCSANNGGASVCGSQSGQ